MTLMVHAALNRVAVFETRVARHHIGAPMKSFSIAAGIALLAFKEIGLIALE